MNIDSELPLARRVGRLEPSPSGHFLEKGPILGTPSALNYVNSCRSCISIAKILGFWGVVTAGKSVECVSPSDENGDPEVESFLTLIA